MGAPLGNKNAANGKRWQKAMERVLARKYGDVDTGLEKLAEKFIDLHEIPEATAEICKDVADRFDGKPRQQIEATGADDGPIKIVVTSDVSGVV